MARVSEPERVRTPVDAFQEPVIAEVSEKARTSSADWKPEKMVTVADSMLVSSASVMVRDESMTVAPSPSVKASVLPAPVVTGASLTAVMVRAMACVVVPPQSSVMVTLKESLPLAWALGV